LYHLGSAIRPPPPSIPSETQYRSLSLSCPGTWPLTLFPIAHLYQETQGWSIVWCPSGDKDCGHIYAPVCSPSGRYLARRGGVDGLIYLRFSSVHVEKRWCSNDLRMMPQNAYRHVFFAFFPLQVSSYVQRPVVTGPVLKKEQICPRTKSWLSCNSCSWSMASVHMAAPCLQTAE